MPLRKPKPRGRFAPKGKKPERCEPGLTARRTVGGSYRATFTDAGHGRLTTSVAVSEATVREGFDLPEAKEGQVSAERYSADTHAAGAFLARSGIVAVTVAARHAGAFAGWCKRHGVVPAPDRTDSAPVPPSAGFWRWAGSNQSEMATWVAISTSQGRRSGADGAVLGQFIVSPRPGADPLEWWFALWRLDRQDWARDVREYLPGAPSNSSYHLRPVSGGHGRKCVCPGTKFDRERYGAPGEDREWAAAEGAAARKEAAEALGFRDISSRRLAADLARVAYGDAVIYADRVSREGDPEEIAFAADLLAATAAALEPAPRRVAPVKADGALTEEERAAAVRSAAAKERQEGERRAALIAAAPPPDLPPSLAGTAALPPPVRRIVAEDIIAAARRCAVLGIPYPGPDIWADWMAAR